ncbi:response regulator, partial [bacterium]|nr:response regulator [bacterium]
MSRHILVVDDESGIRESLSIGLSREGYEVSTASDAESALAAVSRAHPDLALVDVRMPGCDGSAAPRHQVPASLTPAGLWVMRQFLDLGIPVVMISGNATLQEAVQAVKEGAFDFLEKPISIDKVLVTISR